jgi:hypothetical protein
MSLSLGACAARGELIPRLAYVKVGAARATLLTGLDKATASLLIVLEWRCGLGERDPEEDAVCEGT